MFAVDLPQVSEDFIKSQGKIKMFWQFNTGTKDETVLLMTEGEIVFENQPSNSVTKQNTEITLPTILKEDIDEKIHSRLCPKEKFYNTYADWMCTIAAK